MERFKMNFDASIFQDGENSGVRAIIRNDRGEVMAALSAKGPPMTGSDKAEIYACRRAMNLQWSVVFQSLSLRVITKL